jgi:hypothetical protein
MKRIDEQDKKIDELVGSIATLKEHIVRLSICKVTNDHFPYYNFIVSAQLTAIQIDEMNLLLLVLSDYLNNCVGDRHSYLVKKLGIENIFDKDNINKAELKNYIKSILQVDSWELPSEMLTKMKEQGVGGQAVDFLLEE